MNLIDILATAAMVFIGLPATSHADPGSPWGARAPARCDALKASGAPTAAQARQLVRCGHENASTSSGELWLMEDLVVQVGSAQPFKALYNTYTMADADTNHPVYPIRGSFTWSVCMLRKDAAIAKRDPDQNCRETTVSDAKGVCWHTAFGDRRCSLTGASRESRSPTRPRTAADR